MLQDKDRIFTNLYGRHDWGLAGARARGSWDRITSYNVCYTKLLRVSFLFPWAVAFGDLGGYGYWSMIVFLAVLTIGFIYEWKKGALEWD